MQYIRNYKLEKMIELENLKESILESIRLYNDIAKECDVSPISICKEKHSGLSKDALSKDALKSIFGTKLYEYREAVETLKEQGFKYMSPSVYNRGEITAQIEAYDRICGKTCYRINFY